MLKLRTMGPEEISLRALDWAFCWYERRLVSRRSPHSELDVDAPVNAGNEPRPRFFPSIGDPAALRAALNAEFATEMAATLRRADDLLCHRVQLFGRQYDLGQSINWHADPPTGWVWPSIYHRDVLDLAPRDGSVDIKHVWELNRHQFIVDLGTAWFVTGKREYLEQICGLVGSWCDQNPVGVGVNWAGSLDVAYRALSWLWTYHLVDAGLPSDRDIRARWRRSFREHGGFLYRHLEYFSSPYNHLIGEAAVLFMLGLLFPEWPEARKWTKRGRHVLEQRLPMQFYADGGSVEQAVVYHHATLGFSLLAALLAREHGAELSTQVWSAIERAIEWSMFMQQPDGRQPAIGDNDDARPIRFSRPDVWDFRHFQAIGAVLFGRGDFKFAAGQFHQDGLWVLGPEAISRFEGISATRPTARSMALKESGYVVLRSDWAATADYVCFDVGEQAGGLRHDALQSAAHGHADCLSVLVYLAGHPLLVDAGFYTYNGDPRWERFFRDTEAHNTIQVDGRCQSVYFGKMTWAEAPRVALEAFHLNAGSGVPWVSGSHDGYARGEHGVRHTRTVLMKPDVCVAVFDELTGSGEHPFAMAYQFAPELPATLQGARAQLGDEFTVAVAASTPVQAKLTRGGESAAGGWVAPSLDVRVPAGRFSVSGRFSGPGVDILTVIASGPVKQDTPLINDDEWPAMIRQAASRRLSELLAER